MRYTKCSTVAQVLVVLAVNSVSAVAVTFQVADEEDGPMCWLNFQMSDTQTLAIFSGKGNGGNAVDILLEDKQETGSLSKVPEKFEMTFQFADGTHRSYQGSINEYFGEPYAQAKSNLLQRLSNGESFELVVSGIGAIRVKDTLSKKTYNKFMSCVSR
jgi:hypothetical protein